MAVHECGHPRCRRQVSGDMLACRAHWYELPRGLRQRVYATYRRRQRTGDARGHREALRDASMVWADRIRDLEAGGPQT